VDQFYCPLVDHFNWPLTFWGALYPMTIGKVAANVTSIFENITKLMTAAAYASGSGMFLVVTFQFRQHKENPTQVPLSKPMMFLAIVAALVYLPLLIGFSCTTVFGTDATVGTW
jgi:intracellular multiplication protein IcmD